VAGGGSTMGWVGGWVDSVGGGQPVGWGAKSLSIWPIGGFQKLYPLLRPKHSQNGVFYFPFFLSYVESDVDLIKWCVSLKHNGS
jgi:hypothetical protein